jgi:hypothetical protein
LADAVEHLAGYFFMYKKGRRKSPRTTPATTSVDDALDRLGGSLETFTGLFAGWEPQQVKNLAAELEEKIPALALGESCEERILCVLMRLKLSAATWEIGGFFFQRTGGALCSMFTDTVKLILDDLCELVELEGISRVPAEILEQCRDAALEKYRQAKGDPDAELPLEFEGINALMDGSHFSMCRPGGPEEIDLQRAYFAGHKMCHTINVLYIVLLNGLRLYAGFESGRHADPFLYNDDVHEICEETGLVLLCDAIFAANDVCKPMPGFSSQALAAAECVLASALRIPVEWSMLLKQDYPLLTTKSKLKLLGTRPRSLVEIGTLFANFKLCLTGEGITTFYGIFPPHLHEYMRGAVCRD